MFASLMKWMKAARILPTISDTEAQALEAGTVWMDGEFFGGRPDFSKLLADPYSRLSAEEQAFLDGPCERLLSMIDRYEIARTKRVPDDVIATIKREGFMGLIIPKAYGGKEFSTLGVSSVMAKVSPFCNTVGTFVLIPNSLGAAELIIHYGTQAQKDHYLPRLASGEYVPCFGLTEPTAGSDAASIKADALVFRDADGALKLKLNFRKRYITLGPIATLCTIACRVRDPQNLLGKGEDVGITCVMVHKGTPGFTSGDHHDPIGVPFYNGPLYGKDVVVPVDNIIGGTAYAGQGWRMLMEQLAGGRAVSLPASSIGGAKQVAVTAGAYSMVRQQFGLPIGRMEGVEEKVGHIAGLTYLLEGSRVFGCSAIDAGHQPPVVSAVLKAYSTDLYQKLAIDGMDVMAGAAVMQGPNNILARNYTSAPVGVTVEGANILTRTLMIFGQGATRCHPYAFKVVEGVQKDDVKMFRAGLLGWIGHFIRGLLRAETHFLTRGLFVPVPDVAPETRGYYRRLGWAAARYGVMTDLAMFAIGGKLKARGKLTGRYADALAWMMMGFSALRRFEAEGRRKEDAPLVHYAAAYALAKVQEAFVGIYRNFDGPLGRYLKTVGVFELHVNPVGALPTDRQSHEAALCIQSDGPQFQRLAEGVFLPQNEEVGLGRLLRAFRIVTQAHPAAERIIHAQKAKQLPRGYLPAEIADEAVKAGIVTPEEAALLHQALDARLDAIQVDEFKPDEYFATVDRKGGLGFKMAVNA